MTRYRPDFRNNALLFFGCGDEDLPDFAVRGVGARFGAALRGDGAGRYAKSISQSQHWYVTNSIHTMQSSYKPQHQGISNFFHATAQLSDLKVNS